MPPLVSVVIPHFERSGLLHTAIASVLRSTHASIEVVVVDDGSSDQEWKRIEAFRTEKVEVLQRSDGAKGPSRCRNLGIEASRGEYVIFLDSDDLMAPWCVERRLNCVREATAADFWIFPVLLFEEKPGDRPTLWNDMANARDSVSRFVSSDPPWHTSSPLWLKSSLRSVGGFNEAVFYGDDSDLHMRALLSGLEPKLFPRVLPDVFVRRSSVRRITNSLSPDLIASRQVRLDAGTRFLKSRAEGARHLDAWAGQYFFEAEFLLFNTRDVGALHAVLLAWETEFSPTKRLRQIVRAYFAIAVASRDRMYGFLRVARRVAMKLLPPAFFPSVLIANPTVDRSVLAELRSRLNGGTDIVSAIQRPETTS